MLIITSKSPQFVLHVVQITLSCNFQYKCRFGHPIRCIPCATRYNHVYRALFAIKWTQSVVELLQLAFKYLHFTGCIAFRGQIITICSGSVTIRIQSGSMWCGSSAIRIQWPTIRSVSSDLRLQIVIARDEGVTLFQMTVVQRAATYFLSNTKYLSIVVFIATRCWDCLNATSSRNGWNRLVIFFRI